MRLLDPAILEDPYPVYAQWQEQMPIWRDEETGAWVLTRHDDIRSVLKNSADYSSIAMGQRGGGFPLPLLTDDPPRHTQLRGLVDRAFTVRMLKAIEARVNTLAQQMVGDLPQGEGVDIAQALTIPLPVAVISQMMGIPAERAEDFKRWSDALTGTLAGASIEDQKKDIFEMAAYFQSLIPERRSLPGDDLVSAVVNAEIDGARLSDEDIVGFNILSSASAPNSSTFFVQLDRWEDRSPEEHSLAIVRTLNREFATEITEGMVVALGPPPIPGLGTSAGFTLMLQDRSGGSPEYLAELSSQFIAAANARPEIARAYTLYRSTAPAQGR